MIQAVAMLAGVLLGVAPGSTPGPAASLDRAGLQERYGIRVDQIAVTGGGGLVDFRFTVVDPAKARPLLQEHARPARLEVEGTDAPLDAPMHGMMRNVRLQKDAACFLLFPNARGSVHPGTRVSVLFGDVRLEPIAAK